MSIRRPILFLLLGFLLSTSRFSIATEVFKAQTLDGESVRLSEYFEPHKWTLVMIWTTYCKVCAGQFPAIEALHRKHIDKTLNVVGVAVDGFEYRDRVTATLQQRHSTFTVLVGEIADIAASVERATAEPFSGTPTYLLFNVEGELAARISGPLETSAIERYISSIE